MPVPETSIIPAIRHPFRRAHLLAARSYAAEGKQRVYEGSQKARRPVADRPRPAEPPIPEGFTAARRHVSPEPVARGKPRASPERHLAAIDRFVQAGYDHIILVQVGPNQDAFFDLFERDLAPALRARAA
jgi:hypothetical protein